MQFVLVFILQRYFFYVLHESDDEIAGANKWVYNMHAGIRQRSVELGLQEIFNAVSP